MVVRDAVTLQEKQFRERLKKIVKGTLSSLAVVGALSLANCGTSSNQEQVTETKKEYSYPEVTSVDGRRPEGLSLTSMDGDYCGLEDREVVSMFFAKSAYLESAAVVAFEYLARELEAYNAPSSLIAIAHEAIDEEIEHARQMTELARHFGSAIVPEVEVAPFQLRPLHQIAFENALEGCTRETYGALKALWQAEVAQEACVREVYAKVGFEESRHAALSWAIDEWVRPLLTQEQEEERTRLQQEALAELRKETNRPVHPALMRLAGYPSPEAAQMLLQEQLA
ncbi:MAG: hypothetical protein H6728_10590 [Myxococcales bacterium]|nr:hypothetical protein [Myxococcales bacterium]MCB9643506.1 hypothetical protein [Myxococcales bacterium]